MTWLFWAVVRDGEARTVLAHERINAEHILLHDVSPETEVRAGE